MGPDRISEERPFRDRGGVSLPLEEDLHAGETSAQGENLAVLGAEIDVAEARDAAARNRAVRAPALRRVYVLLAVFAALGLLSIVLNGILFFRAA